MTQKAQRINNQIIVRLRKPPLSVKHSNNILTIMLAEKASFIASFLFVVGYSNAFPIIENKYKKKRIVTGYPYPVSISK